MTALTVAQVIERLQACNPDAYPMLDDNGTPLEVVGVEDGYCSYLANGNHVEAVYLMLRGDYEAGERRRYEMELWAASHPPMSPDDL